MHPVRDPLAADPYERMPTGVPGLDTILHGGLLKGGVYLMLGPPGSGKTILCNQICFNHAQNSKGNVVYVTLLAESHSRMMGNLSALGFFQDDLVAKSIHYVSGYRALEQEGLKGLLLLIANLIREKKASLLLVDGISTIGELDQTPLSFRKFVHELNTFIATSGCTALLMSSMEGHLSHPEHTMVDGIISLHLRSKGLRSIRQLEVRKFRGSDHAYGKHFFRILPEGIHVYPRIESLPQPEQGVQVKKARKKTGVEGLDQMLGGGLAANSATGLLGASGTGKSTLGIQFLEQGAKEGESGIYFGLYETACDLEEKADELGLSLRKYVKSGKIEILWHPAQEQELDELAFSLLSAVKRSDAKRVFIDGIDGLRYSSSYPNRLKRFVAALFRMLKASGVTVVFSEEISLFQPSSRRKVSELSSVNDNLLLFEHVRYDGDLTRAVSIVKVRTSHYDARTHELTIAKGGMKILGPISASSRPRAGQRK